MPMVIRYIVGLIILVVFGFLLVKSIVSIVNSIRMAIKKRKSPDKNEGTTAEVSAEDSSGKEVDKE